MRPRNAIRSLRFASRRRRLAAVAVGAVALAGIAGGAAIAASSSSSPQAESQAILQNAAGRLGVQPAQLSDAVKKAEEDQVDALVAAGTLTQAQGDALKQQIENGNAPLFTLPGLFRHGFERFGGGPGFEVPFGLGDAASAVATYLGLTPEQLRTQLESGKSLADIANAQPGKSVARLEQAIKDAAQKSLDAAVSAGKLTQAQESAILAKLDAHIGDLVNGTAAVHFGRGFGGFGGFGVPGGPPFGLPFGRGGMLSTAATYLGLTEAQLQTQLSSGKTLADVANAQPGKSVAGLEQALTDAATKSLDAAVSAGKLTKAQETTILSRYQQGIGDFVNRAQFRFDRHGPDDDHGGPGWFGPAQGSWVPAPPPSGSSGSSGSSSTQGTTTA